MRAGDHALLLQQELTHDRQGRNAGGRRGDCGRAELGGNIGSVQPDVLHAVLRPAELKLQRRQQGRNGSLVRRIDAVGKGRAGHRAVDRAGIDIDKAKLRRGSARNGALSCAAGAVDRDAVMLLFHVGSCSPIQILKNIILENKILVNFKLCRIPC